MDFASDHAVFVLLSYALTGLALIGLLMLGVWRVRALNRRLARMADTPRRDASSRER